MSDDSARDDPLLDRLLDGELAALGPEASTLDPARRTALERLIGLVGAPLSGQDPDLPAPLSADDLDGAGFRTVGLLGSGAHSTVYEAEDLALGRHVALKVVQAGWDDETAQRTFLREARTLAKIDHCNVVRIWSAARHDGRLLLALELIEGHTLREVLAERGPMPPRQAARVGRDVARALAVVHEQRILHRDVNPNNVMIERGGRTLLLDFSVARIEESEQLRRGGTLGSPVYEAPEVLAGGAPSERSDVYALGILMAWMCSGSSPFGGLTWGELRQNVLAGRRLPLEQVCPGMPKGLRRIVERALRREPGRRTPDARTMARELERFVGRPYRLALACGAAIALALTGVGLRVQVGKLAVREEKERELAALTTSKADAEQRALDLDALRGFLPLDAPRGLEELSVPRDDPAEGLGFQGRRLRVRQDYATIAQALASARDGDVLLLEPDEYSEQVEIANVSIALVGVEGAARTVIDAGGADKPVVLAEVLDELRQPPASVRVAIRGVGLTGGRGWGTSSVHGSDWYGGGVAGIGSALDLLVEECAVWNNGRRGTTFGGGLLLRGGRGGRLVARRCLIAGNGAWACGGGILVDGGDALVEHCTIVMNHSGSLGGVQGGIGLANGARVAVLDSILWGNRGEQVGGFGGFDWGVTIDLERSLIQNGALGGTILDLPPLFRDAARSDWRLSPSSPARAQGVALRSGQASSDLGAFRWSEPSDPSSSLPSTDGEDRWPYLLGVVPAGVERLGAPDDGELDGVGIVLRVPEEQVTIQAALDAAPDGATIVLAAGHYREALRLPARSVRIVGQHGAGSTVIDSKEHTGPTLDVDAPRAAVGPPARIRVRGVTLRGGMGRLLENRGVHGGALAVSGAIEVELEGCVIWCSGRGRNTFAGGALWVGPSASVLLRECLVARNAAYVKAGAALVEGGTLVIDHCTFTENHCERRFRSQSAIALESGGHLVVRDSVLWGDSGSEILILGEGCEADVASSIVEGGFPGSGVLDEDPGFADPSGADWSRGDIPPVGVSVEARARPETPR